MKRWERRGGENPEDQAEGERHAGETSQYAAVWRSWRRHRDRGSRQREVVVIAPRSRNRAVTDKDPKTSWGKRIAKRYLGAKSLGSSSLSGPGRAASGSPVILGVKADHEEGEMKVQDVLVKVYDTGRLQRAWQQVRTPERPGLTRCVPSRLHRRFLSGLIGSATDLRAAYFASTYRSVGTG